MREFWQLANLMISLAGFLIVAGVLLWGGESLLPAALRAAAAFAVLWVAQAVLRALLGLTIGPETQTTTRSSDGNH